ncbi:hypothetical protein GCM10007862_07810 [Dyella lipolytica]|uniref:HprK-related kinase B n=1 Tax=Dyella lipolytica TaxID=1867835 RepID=A0ABW8IYP5_9GAMM|nr:hypothetical protein [Dyella lipolytica]GLQ45730.1 hypothetical protein GCM10007862_07810 [Dyella lipolytica]
MKKIIFGRCYLFSGEASHESLLECLELYADAGDIEPQVEVRIARALTTQKPSAINPKAHRKFGNGMLTSFPAVDVGWRWSDRGRLEVEVVLKIRRGIKHRIQKLLSMEYASAVESFEQILHEFVLVPSAYFFKDVAPIHASCMTVDGRACLLAGTGGAGKSAAMLALRRNEHVGFVGDDIVFISAESSHVHANMAWPKIYGYNCAGNVLKSEILAGRGWIDKAHFNIKTWINAASARRKIRPDRLYRKVESASSPLSRLYYVVREDVSDIRVSDLDVANAVEMSIAVISAEYSIFHDHLYWEKYNALVTEKPPMLTLEDVVANWRIILSKGLANVACSKVSIPFEMDPIVYRNSMASLLMTEMAARS